MPTVEAQTNASSTDDSDFLTVGLSWSNNVTYSYIGLLPAIYHCGCSSRFVGINIPARATITTAYVSFCGYGSKNAVGSLTRLRCANEKNPSTNAGYGEHYSRWEDGTVQVDWDDVQYWDQEFFNSPDISTCVQQVVDDNGGTGDALMVFWDDYDSRETAWLLSIFQYWATHPEYSATIHIEYDLGRRIFVTGYST